MTAITEYIPDRFNLMHSWTYNGSTWGEMISSEFKHIWTVGGRCWECTRCGTKLYVVETGAERPYLADNRHPDVIAKEKFPGNCDDLLVARVISE